MRPDAYLVGATDADLFAPAEHRDGRATLTLRCVGRALRAAELPTTIANIREYLSGFNDHAGFLMAAADLGAVDYQTGGVQ